MGETSSCLVADDELSCVQPTPVPEPSVVLLLVVALVCGWRWRRG